MQPKNNIIIVILCARIENERSRKNINENSPFLLPPHALGFRYIERPAL